MLMDFEDLYNRYNMNVTGVLHAGAHEGQEADIYEKLGFHPITWVEANREVAERLSAKVGPRGHNVINALLSDRSGVPTKFNITNNEQSSSILELGTHAAEHPEVVYVDEVTMISTTIDDLGLEKNYNFLNMDLQGAEGLVLDGATRFLQSVDYVMTEVNRKPLYVGCALIREIDEKLADFTRVETEWTRHGWGDAFYVRNN